jgi:hypothetical protein
MGGIRILLLALAAFVSLAGAGDWARAQEGPGGYLNPGRDCQTITTCRFQKGGSYRGCLSSYSCRVCKFVPPSALRLGRLAAHSLNLRRCAALARSVNCANTSARCSEMS